MNNVADLGNIQPTCRQVGRNQDVVGTTPELDQVFFTVYLFHRAMEYAVFKVIIFKYLTNPFYGIAVIAKDQAYLLIEACHEPHQRFYFVCAVGADEPQLEFRLRRYRDKIQHLETQN